MVNVKDEEDRVDVGADSSNEEEASHYSPDDDHPVSPAAKRSGFTENLGDIRDHPDVPANNTSSPHPVATALTSVDDLTVPEFQAWDTKHDQTCSRTGATLEAFRRTVRARKGGYSGSRAVAPADYPAHIPVSTVLTVAPAPGPTAPTHSTSALLLYNPATLASCKSLRTFSS